MTRSSSTKVRILGAFFSVVYLIGEPSSKKGKRALPGDLDDCWKEDSLQGGPRNSCSTAKAWRANPRCHKRTANELATAARMRPSLACRGEAILVVVTM